MTQKENEFFRLAVLKQVKYDEIEKRTGWPKSEYGELWQAIKKERDLAGNAKQLFNNKKLNPDFKEFLDQGFCAFYDWYILQKRECYYCGIPEEKIRRLFVEKKLETKRGRGQSLELERRDSKRNDYSPTNCVFACYFCNNHKSDIISEVDFKKYFASSIRNYLDTKYFEAFGSELGSPTG